MISMPMSRLILILTACALSGCGMVGPKPMEYGSTADIEKRLASLEAQLKAANDHQAETQATCDELTQQIAKLKFANQQLSRQLEAVGDAPRQRDQLRQQVARLEADLATARQELNRVQGAGAASAPAGLPSSQNAAAPLPASSPAQP